MLDSTKRLAQASPRTNPEGGFARPFPNSHAQARKPQIIAININTDRRGVRCTPTIENAVEITRASQPLGTLEFEWTP